MVGVLYIKSFSKRKRQKKKTTKHKIKTQNVSVPLLDTKMMTSLNRICSLVLKC